MARFRFMRRRLLICFRKIQSLEQTLTCRLPLRGLLLLLLLCLLLLLLRLFRSPEAPSSTPEFDNEPEADETVKEVPAPPSLDDLVTDPNQVAASGSDGNTGADGEEDLDDAYAKLYESGVPSRHKGYYFGPLFGLIYPATDIATRTPNSLSPEVLTELHMIRVPGT